MISSFAKNVFNGAPAQRAALALLGQHQKLSEKSKPARDLAEDPQPDTTRDLLCHLKSVAGKHKTVYVSTPITGGMRLYEFLASHGATSKKDLNEDEQAAYGREVVKPNIRKAERRAEALREKGLLAINPTAVAIPKWGQPEYNRNWVEVLSKVNLAAVMLCPGWQLSYGCLLEVRTALDRGIKVNDEQDQPLTRADAIKRVNQAVSYVQSVGLDVGKDLPRVLTAPMDTLPMEA